MSKSNHPFMQLLVMLAITLGMLLLSVIIMMPFGIGGFSRNTMLWMQGITQLLTFLLPVALMTLIYYRGRQREFCRLDFSGRKWLLGLAGVAVMLLLIPVIDWLTVWNDEWDLGRVGELLRSMQDSTEGIMDQMLAGDTVGTLLANLLVVALIPAVCEEVFFRAGVQNLLQRWFGNHHAAIWVTALLFSLGHGELFAFMPRFLMGAVLGYLYVYGGSIVPNVLAHFANNALVVVIYWLVGRGVLDIDPEAPLRVGVLLTVCCTLAAAGVFWVTFLMRGRKGEDTAK